MRVAITLRRAQLHAGGCRAHAGRYRIDLRVNGTAIGDADHELGQGDHHLGGDAWTHRFDDDEGQLRVRCVVRDGDCWSETVEQTWRPPYPRDRVITGAGFVLGVRVESAARRRSASSRVSVPRSSPTQQHRATVVTPSPQIRFEIDPVIPFPERATSLRPAWTHAMPPTFERRELRIDGGGSSHIVNPCVVARTVDRAWAATISYTRIWAPGWTEAALNSRIRWRVRSLDGGASVDFIGPDRGTVVRVLGRDADGEVAVDAMIGDRVLATHRALVRRPVVLPARFTVTEVPPNFPRVVDFNGQPMDVSVPVRGALTRAVNDANRRLEALALRIGFDDSRQAVDAHTRPSEERGCFVRTAQVTEDVRPPEGLLGEMVRRNAIPHVLSFAIAPSMPGANVGVAVLPCLAGGPERDSGTPSSSWDSPTGVFPDQPARLQEIRALTSLMEVYLTRLQGSRDHLYGAVIHRWAGGSTIAHETGHVLGLRHRHPDADGRPSRPENLMTEGHSLGGDFDILQARVVWNCALVRHWYRATHGALPP